MKPGDLILYRTMNIYGEYVPQYGIVLNEEYHQYFNVLMCGGKIKLIADLYIELMMRTITQISMNIAYGQQKRIDINPGDLIKYQAVSGARFLGIVIDSKETGFPRNLTYLHVVCNDDCVKRINTNLILSIEVIQRRDEIMTWDYRVIKHIDEGEVSYQIHEVYYDEDQVIKSWTENSIKPYGETPEELKEDILMQTQAFQKPILEFNLCKDSLVCVKIDI